MVFNRLRPAYETLMRYCREWLSAALPISDHNMFIHQVADNGDIGIGVAEMGLVNGARTLLRRAAVIIGSVPEGPDAMTKEVAGRLWAHVQSHATQILAVFRDSSSWRQGTDILTGYEAARFVDREE